MYGTYIYIMKKAYRYACMMRSLSSRILVFPDQKRSFLDNTLNCKKMFMSRIALECILVVQDFITSIVDCPALQT